MIAPQYSSADRPLPDDSADVALATGSSALLWPRCILVAIDGTAATDPALRAAHVLASRTACNVDVAAMYAPRIPVPQMPNRRGIDACERWDRVDATHLITTVRARYRELIPDRRDRAEWQLHLEVGNPGATLVRVAAEIQPDLVIAGIAQREVRDQAFAGQTAICAARYLAIPLLAAASDGEAPSRAIVAFPDGKLHAPTLRAVLATVARPAELWLAFPERHAGGDPAFAPDADSDAMAAAVRALCGGDIAATLGDVRLHRVAVDGDMLNATLRLGAERSAQLIAIPNHGDPGPVRSFLPNLAEPLLLGARCSVLVVPDPSSRASMPA